MPCPCFTLLLSLSSFHFISFRFISFRSVRRFGFPPHFPFFGIYETVIELYPYAICGVAGKQTSNQQRKEKRSTRNAFTTGNILMLWTLFLNLDCIIGLSHSHALLLVSCPLPLSLFAAPIACLLKCICFSSGFSRFFRTFFISIFLFPFSSLLWICWMHSYNSDSFSQLLAFCWYWTQLIAKIFIIRALQCSVVQCNEVWMYVCMCGEMTNEKFNRIQQNNRRIWRNYGTSTDCLPCKVLISCWLQIIKRSHKWNQM